MRRISRIFMAVAITSSMFLSGCSDADMAKLNKMASQFETISENVNTIAEKANEIDSEQIAESVESISESAQTISEATEETVETVSEEPADVADIDELDISLEDIMEVYGDTPAGILLELPDRNMQAIADAREQYTKGLNMLNEGYAALMAAEKSSASVKTRIRDAFDGAEEMLKGANLASDSLSVLVENYTDMASDLLKVADVVGIENDNIDALKEAVESMPKDIDFYVVPTDVIDQIEDIKAEVLVAISNNDLSEIDVDKEIDAVFEELKPLVEGLNELNESSAVIMKEANKAAQSIIDESAKYGIKGDGLDLAKKILEVYEDEKVVVIDIETDQSIDEMFEKAQDLIKDKVKDGQDYIDKNLNKKK